MTRPQLGWYAEPATHDEAEPPSWNIYAPPEDEDFDPEDSELVAVAISKPLALRIVRAVNNHESLLEAARALLTHLPPASDAGRA